MRVLTLNLWGRNGDWKARRDVIQAGLRRLSPDVIAFQEAIVTETYDQVRDLLGPDGFQVVHQTIGLVGDGNRISVAARAPINAVHEIDLHLTPRTAGFSCATLICELADPPMLFAHHFPSYESGLELERESQAVVAADRIERILARHAVPVVVAGDLDAEPDAASLRFWTGRQSLAGTSVRYADCWETFRPGEPGHTFTPANRLMREADAWDRGRRIDYILVREDEHGRPSFRVARCDLAFAEPVDGVWASDHFGVVADLAER